ncbi:MAG: HAMP domain-containing sensor histidine kinase [Actinomycetota bacterium]
MAETDLSSTAASQLRSLRVRITALIALLSILIVAGFAVVVIRIDRDLRDERIETEVLRLGDLADRQASFIEGSYEADRPIIDRVALVINPSFSRLEFEAQAARLGLAEPNEEQMRTAMESLVRSAELEYQAVWFGDLLRELEDEALVEQVDLAALIDRGSVVVQRSARSDGIGETVTIVRDDLMNAMLDDPPDDVFDEAYRRFVFERAEAAGLELQFDPVVYPGPLVDVDEEQVLTIGEQAIESRGAVDATVEATSGDARIVRADVLIRDATIRGAAVAVVDPTGFDADHVGLRNRVIALAVALVGVSVIAAWFVAGRTTRPMARALGQQERFLADAAHELRTPVAAIRLTAEAADEATSAASLQRVAELAADASTLTDNLLTLARMDADRLQLQRDRVRMDLLVESTIDAIPGAREATLVEPSAPVVADIDPGLVQRAIGNMVRNAIAHGEATAATPAVVTLDATDTGFSLRVRDHGPGIDPSMADDVFERFRAQTGSSGHGLGLPLSRWIARAHGGELAIVDTSSAGTTLELTLPR